VPGSYSPPPRAPRPRAVPRHPSRHLRSDGRQGGFERSQSQRLDTAGPLLRLRSATTPAQAKSAVSAISAPCGSVGTPALTRVTSLEQLLVKKQHAVFVTVPAAPNGRTVKKIGAADPPDAITLLLSQETSTWSDGKPKAAPQVQPDLSRTQTRAWSERDQDSVRRRQRSVRCWPSRRRWTPQSYKSRSRQQ
jgi:hypothetical protein